MCTCHNQLQPHDDLKGVCPPARGERLGDHGRIATSDRGRRTDPAVLRRRVALMADMEGGH